MKKILILITVASLLVKATSLFALPVYKNYSNTDIFTTKFKVGYYNGSSKVKGYNFTSNENGVDFSLEINPLYNLKVLHNIYVGLNANLAAGGELKNNSLIFMLNYNLPLEIPLPDWFPVVNIFAGGGYGVRQTVVDTSSKFTAFNINKSSNVIVLGFGVEITPKQLKDYNLGLYLAAKSLISSYETADYGEKKDRKYINNFVTIGLMYKINYLIK